MNSRLCCYRLQPLCAGQRATQQGARPARASRATRRAHSLCGRPALRACSEACAVRARPRAPARAR
eukprot:6200175-Pleurochrysis_carterae.AAC.1